MINSKKIGSAFALGVEVATGTIVETKTTRKLRGAEAADYIASAVERHMGPRGSHEVLETRLREILQKEGYLEIDEPPADGVREFTRKRGVHTEAFARRWIEDQVLFAQLHPTSPEVAHHEELRAALEASYEAGKKSKVKVPVPVVLPPLAGEELERLIAEGKV
jgi:hypothetical protein